MAQGLQQHHHLSTAAQLAAGRTLALLSPTQTSPACEKGPATLAELIIQWFPSDGRVLYGNNKIFGDDAIYPKTTVIDLGIWVVAVCTFASQPSPGMHCSQLRRYSGCFVPHPQHLAAALPRPHRPAHLTEALMN